ncbi:MAG: glutamyl-tRNA reductase [Candidatus Obscuribacterales bacterium]|nr:glutamyl-tRNA reductase [Candidatus Obscuribacterales bacterium]
MSISSRIPQATNSYQRQTVNLSEAKSNQISTTAGRSESCRAEMASPSHEENSMVGSFEGRKRPISDAGTAHLVVVGINYHTSPIFVREKFVIPESCLVHALSGLAHMPHLKEAVILSTCNRTEVYAVVSDVQAGLREIESFFMSTQKVSDHGVLKPNFKLLRDDVALHLFRVASGLDSLVLGESQIMSQVKTAYRKALDAGTAGPVLGQLFQTALACGKRVRSETSMGRRAVSVSSAAIELAREVLGSLTQRKALIVGAGRMSQICAKHLLGDSGSESVIMLNRSTDRLKKFAENELSNKHKLNMAFGFEERHQLVAASDLVIVSTSAPDYLITQEQLKKYSIGRKICIIDIAVPRNVDPEVAKLPGVTLYHADDLASVVNKNLAERESITAEADRIVFDALDLFHDWERSLLVAPTIIELRKKIESIRAEHMVKHERKQEDGPSAQKEEFEELSRALINQILHHPTTQLKSTSDYHMLKQQAEALRTLFHLDPLESRRGSEGGCPARGVYKSIESFLQTP